MPLVRLRVEYSGGFDLFNPQRFGQSFVDRVANPKEIISLFRRKQTYVPGMEGLSIVNVRNLPLSHSHVPDIKGKRSMEMMAPTVQERLSNIRVETLVAEYLQAQNLDILPENELEDAVRTFVEKEERDAIKE